MRDEVALELVDAEDKGGVAEVDASIGRDVAVVGEAHGDAVDRGDQDGDVAARRIHLEQSAMGVAHDDRAVRMHLDAERSTTGLREALDMAAVGGDA